MAESCAISSRHDPEQTPEAQAGYVCHDCYGRLRKTLQQLPAIAGWLHVNLAAGGVAGERVGGTREDPIPLRQDVLDLIGPDSRHYATEHAEPVYLLWEDGTVIGVFDSWPDAPWRDAMLAAGVPGHVVAMLRKPFTRQQWLELPDEDKNAMDAAHTRWQIRPVARGGRDQRGADAARAVLAHYAQVVHTEGGKPYPAMTAVTRDGRVLGEYRDRDIADEDCRWLRWARRRIDDPRRWNVRLVPARGGWVDLADARELAEFLAGHMSWIAEQPWVDDFHDEIHRLSSEAHRIAPWRAETRRDPEPCGCGVRAVVWHIAEGFTRCERSMGGCGREQKVTEHAMNANLPETRKAAG